jgi:hypothetical protein
MIDTSAGTARTLRRYASVDCKMGAYVEDFVLAFRRAAPGPALLLAAARAELFRALTRVACFFAEVVFAGRFFAGRFFAGRFFAGRFLTRSGSALPPVERFHSSYCSSVIFPSTSSCANFRR